MSVSTKNTEQVLNAKLRVKPANLRTAAADANATKYFAIGPSSLGLILVARSERGVCSILLGDDPALLEIDLQDRFPQADLISGDDACERLATKVANFIANPALEIDVPLDIHGTAFQQRVWQALLQIPFGSTASYADIANQIDTPKAVRAVARACGANPLAVVIPCHRVVSSTGRLSGYRWGVERKRALLDLEAGV